MLVDDAVRYLSGQITENEIRDTLGLMSFPMIVAAEQCGLRQLLGEDLWGYVGWDNAVVQDDPLVLAS
jgi:hypothetical protein